MTHWLEDQDVLDLTHVYVPEPEIVVPKHDPVPARKGGTLKSMWGYTKLAGLAVALNQGHALFLENFSARADWQAVSRCEITGYISKGPKDTDIESVATTFTSEQNYKPQHGEMDVRATSGVSDTFGKCRDILLTKGFNLWSLEVSHGKAIPGAMGMDGAKGTKVTGMRNSVGLGDMANATIILDDIENSSTVIEQEWNGVTFTLPWYKAQWQKIERPVEEWKDAKMQSIKTGYVRLIDNTTSMLQSTKPDLGVKQPSP